MPPLSGFTIGITGDRRAAEQAEMFTRRGAEVVHGPVLRTVALDDVDVTTRATADLLAGPVDVIVLTTGVGTRSWLGAAESAGLDDALRAASRQAVVLARGPKARSAAIGGGLDVAWQAPGETSDEIVEFLGALGVTGKRIAVQRDGGGTAVAERIGALGADIVDVPVYRWQLPDDEEPAQRLITSTIAGRIDAVTFTSAVAVDNMFELAREPHALAAAMNGPARAIAVGPVTGGALRRHGVDRVVEPPRARLGAMVQCLVAELGSLRRTLRHGDALATWQGNALMVGDDDADDAHRRRGTRAPPARRQLAVGRPEVESR